MKAPLTLLTLGLLLLSITVQGDNYISRCTLVRILKGSSLDGFQNIRLENWVCLAKYVSDYNTHATKVNHEDQSTTYGIFQISSRYWCKDGKTPESKNFCRKSCKALFKIENSINCAKRILKDPRGITTWEAWRENCQNKNITHFLQGCEL